MIYDPTGRRDDLPTGSAGSGLSDGADTYLYDGSQGIQSRGNAGYVNYLRMPGSGEDLMDATQSSNGNGVPQIALLDGNGSTIAMVNSGTGSVASTYTYDPFGKASYGGSYITAYQYLGMENETLSGATWAYYGGGTYYSPVLGRPLTIQGPITSAGGFGSGPGATVAGFAIDSMFVSDVELGSAYGPPGSSGRRLPRKPVKLVAHASWQTIL